MWGESSKNCEINCQCSGLITENFKINSGSSAAKRKQESLSNNYKLKMNPHSLDFDQSPNSPVTAKRRILGELQNFKPSSPVFERLKNSPDCMNLNNLKSPLSYCNDSRISPINNLKSPLNNLKSPLNNLKSPLNNLKSPLNSQPYQMQSLDFQRSPLATSLNLRSPLNFQAPLNNFQSPLNHLQSPLNTFKSPLTTNLSRQKRSSKITKIFEERSKFKSNKENISETFMKIDEDTRDCSFGDHFQREKDWTMPKLDFTDTIPSKDFENDVLVPGQDDLDDLESLKDLEAEFDNENFDACTNYEIISTDSPNIISRGRGTTRKISSRNFDFGAPLADSEQSTSFNRPTTRTLNFDEDDFEFTSPAVKKTVSVKKSLKFNETPTKSLLRQQSDSSIGSMSLSPASSFHRVFTSDSTTSMESGFISELEEPFLEIDESNSPKIANFNDLLSGQIKDNVLTNKSIKRPNLARSLSFHPENKAKVSLLSILESPEKRKREEEENGNNKRRKSNCEIERIQRPTLQRAFSENNASIMSALARSASEPDLIGDFSQPFSLPRTGGVHSDLAAIEPNTLAELMTGAYSDVVPNYQVIDCRYPYEFSGGHIKDAINIYAPAQVSELIHNCKEKTVLIFHCEFSLQRGPTISRHLRSLDREKNKDNYPSLHYPEIYILHEGYRGFYQRHPELCSPEGYTTMLDPRHKHLLRKHRSCPKVDKGRRNRLLL